MSCQYPEYLMMWMRLTSRLLQAVLITAAIYLTMLLDSTEQPGLQRAASQIQAEQMPLPDPVILN